MFNLIIFGYRKQNQPHNCFMVGVMGCNSITETNLGTECGVDICSYTVKFDDGISIEIEDTIHVST